MSEFVSNPPRIETLRMFPMSDKQIESISYVNVTSVKQMENGRKPSEGGIYDTRMGAQFDYKCGSCNNDLLNCHGHFGHVDLNYPLISPTYFRYIIKWIRIICKHCYKLLFDVSIKELYPDFHTIPKEDYTNEILGYFGEKLNNRKKKIFCDHCNDIKRQVSEGITNNAQFEIKVIQPQYIQNEKFQFFIDELTKIPEGNAKKYSRSVDFGADNIYLPHDQIARLESLSDSEIEKIGLPVECHPKNFGNYKLLIPPVCMRYINNSGKGREGNNYITSNLEAVINYNDMITIKGGVNKKSPLFFDYTISKDQFTAYDLENFIKEYYSYIGIIETADNNTSIYAKFKGKEGLLRGQGLGKVASRNAGRAVIACSPDIAIDEMILPKRFAHTFFIPVIVTPYNIEELKVYVDNGENYPGCTMIYRADIKAKISNNRNYMIQLGDTVFRNVISGDTALLNRSPTLYLTSITSHKIIVHDGNKDKANIGINVLSCAAYNADFDGDTMLIKLVNNEEARYESQVLFDFSRYSRRFEDGSPIIGLVQDALIGCAMLTNSKTKLSRMEAMRIFRNIPIDIKLNKDVYTGRELFSAILPKINYEAPSPMFSQSFMKDFGDFDESDYTIKIVKGELKSGIVCGKIVKDKPNSLFNKIMELYGNKVAQDVLYHMQQISARYIELSGNTISFADIEIGEDSKKLIEILNSATAREVDEFNNKLMEGNINTVDIESEYIKMLTPNAKSYINAIMKTVDPTNNWLIKMVTSGSKGSLGNIINMMAIVGLLKINNHLLPNTLCDYRFGINARQFSDDPRDMGYISSSYKTGWSARDTLAIGIETRQNILTKGLTVATAGYSGKTMVTTLSSLITDHRLFTSRGYGNRIIEFNNCDDGFKSSNTQSNKIELLYFTDKEIEEKYGKTRKSILINERNELLNILYSLQNFNPIYEYSSKIDVPIDFKLIIDNTISDDVVSDDADEKWKLLDEALDNIHYLRINQIHRIKQTKIPECLKVSFTTCRIAMRSIFTKDVVNRYDMNGFKLLLNDISVRISRTFFEAGDPIGIVIALAMAAPLTQYLLDSHHASVGGGTARDGLDYYNSVINHHDLNKAKVKMMYIYLEPQYETDEVMVRKLTEHIRSKKLKDVLRSSAILYEPYGEHKTYPDDKVKEDVYSKKNNIRIDTLENIKFRIVMSKEKMKNKHITVLDIMNKIDYLYDGDIKCIDVSDDTHDIILMYFNQGFSWKHINDISERKKGKINITDIWKEIIEFYNDFNNNTVINQFKGINSAQTKKYKRLINTGDGLKEEDAWYIETNGVNMTDILLVNVVDKSRTRCNNVMETFEYDGLISAKNCIMSEIYNTFKHLGLSPAIYALISNNMIETGEPSKIDAGGQKIREPNDALMRMAFKDPLKTIQEMSILGNEFECNAHNSDILLGQKPRYIGTGRDKLIFNEDFLKQHMKSDSIENYI